MVLIIIYIMFRLYSNIYTMSFTYPCPRKLRQIMKMSLIQKQQVHTIKQIWKDYHEPRAANIADILDKHKYQLFLDRANRSPLFILPIFRANGHFKLITQWQKDTILSTYIQEYKKNGRNAQPYIVFTFFTELLFKKGITLVRGDIINNSMNKLEAQNAWQLLQASYLEEQKHELVYKFNHQQQDFQMDNYNQIFNCE